PGLLAEAMTDEPLFIDLRWVSASPSSSSLAREPRFQSAIASLAAPIHGCSREELEGAEVRERHRLHRTVGAAVVTLAVLLVLALVAATVAYQQRSSAQRATKTAVGQLVAAAAKDKMLAGQADVGLLLAAAASRLSPGPSADTALVGSLT